MFTRSLQAFVRHRRALARNQGVKYQGQTTCERWRTYTSSGNDHTHKNYIRKQRRAQKKASTQMIDTATRLLDGLTNVQKSKKSPMKDTADFLQNQSRVLEDLLSSIKVEKPSNADRRKQLGMPEAREDVIPTLEVPDEYKKQSLFFEGPRLGWFDKTPAEPIYGITIQEDEDRQEIEDLKKLMPMNAFQKMMEDSSQIWKYPIDNEAGRLPEEEVGFEDHTLLDHLIADGFPKKGPVRHFMELVVAGLSRNPHYSMHEKQAFIEWYKDYFSQFPQQELLTTFPVEAGELPGSSHAHHQPEANHAQ